LKIVTLNINNVNKRLQNLVTWLAKTRPDVVCLQELKSEQRAFPARALRALGEEKAPGALIERDLVILDGVAEALGSMMKT
jgi:exonuclease III